VTASDISDIASAVWANTIGARVDSRILVAQSRLSDFNSAFVSQLSDFRSDLGSFFTTTGVALNASALSDLRSAIAAGPAATVTASDISDIASAVRAIIVSDLSDLLSRTTQINSRVALIQSTASDTYSALSDALSAPISASDLSDIASAVWANAIGARVDSRVLLNLSRISDVQSAITAGVEVGASSMSDLRSAIAGITATVSASDMSDIASRVDVLLASRLSDILSAAQQTNSRVLVTQSQASDIYSLLSDLHSDVGVMSGVVSDIYSGLATIPASMLSAAEANPIHANVHEVNDVSLVGNGTLGSEWGPA
jgi:hypothetical protein